MTDKPKTPFASPGYEFRTDAPLAPKGGGKAESERVHRPNDTTKIEDYRASGHAKVAGKHVVADGLVETGGKRRVMPREREMEEIDDIYDLAEQTLRGREATIFTRCVLDFHLDHSRPRTTAADMAAVYGVPETEVLVTIVKAQKKMADARERRRLEFEGLD